MDFSLQLLPEQPLAELIEVIRLADELGYRGCYSADETYHLDDRLRSDFAPHGYNHIALGLVDPALVEGWSGRRIEGLPSLAAQVELFAAEVAPALAGI